MRLILLSLTIAPSTTSTVVNNKHSISRVGHSIVFSVGEVTNPNNIVEANLHNFMEIIGDGSVKLRILLTNNAGKSKVNIACIISILSIFRKIYSQIFETDFSDCIKSVYTIYRI